MFVIFLMQVSPQQEARRYQRPA